MDKSLTAEQIEDIKQRATKALAFLQELQLTPACQLSLENDGTDHFSIRAIPYLQDRKYSGQAVPSPFIVPPEKK